MSKFCRGRELAVLEFGRGREFNNTRHIRNKWSRERAGVDCSTELVSRFSESVNLEYNGPVLNDYLLRFKDLGGIS